MNDNQRTSLWTICIFATGLAAIVAIWCTASHFEARAYNRLTGSDVSMFDAMFVRLRVQGEPDQAPRADPLLMRLQERRADVLLIDCPGGEPGYVHPETGKVMHVEYAHGSTRQKVAIHECHHEEN